MAVSGDDIYSDYSDKEQECVAPKTVKGDKRQYVATDPF
jgi:hypothetical protein